MINKILMPSGGQTTDEMVILKWVKAIGEFVKRGDILFEIETDKAILTVESFAEGILLDIKYPEGQMVKTGEVVAFIGAATDIIPNDTAAPFSKPVNRQETASATVPIAFLQDGNVNSSADLKNRLQVSPLAKKRAEAENIKLQDVANYFSKTIIKKIDIDNYVSEIKKQNHPDNKYQNNLPDTNPGAHYFIDASSMRKTIARRMKESVMTSPHYIISIDVDMTQCIEVRNRLNDNTRGIKISYNDLIMKVASAAIEFSPIINASYTDDKIKVFTEVNFGLAVAVDGGLIVPVVKGANKKSLGEIAKVNAENIEKAKSGKLLEADISGGTITLSSLGNTGVNNFTAIINQPESCILAIGSILPKSTAINKKIKIRDMMNITASFDHRIIDGSYGAAFLKEVKTILENPHLLLL
ncbi:MAG: dihydrolipoamide acetyltransferase family protein [Flavitalea sp.]